MSIRSPWSCVGAGALLTCLLLLACAANPAPYDGAIDRSVDAPIDGATSDAPRDTASDGPDVGVRDATDGPLDVGSSDGGDGGSLDGGLGDGLCDPVSADGSACDPASQLVWVVTDVPRANTAQTSTDMLGGVTPAGVFTRNPAGELVLSAAGGDVVVTTPSPFDGDLRASNNNDIWIVPRSGQISDTSPFFVDVLPSSQFAHWDGATWMVVSAPSPIAGYLTAFWIDASGIWVAAAPPAPTSGKQPAVYSWSNGIWSLAASPLDQMPNAVIAAIWGAAPDDVWAGGEIITGAAFSGPFNALVMHWDGTMWSAVTPTVLGKSWQAVFSIWGSSSHDLWFAGADTTLGAAGKPGGSGDIWHFDGTAWTDTNLVATSAGNGTSAFFNLSGTGPADVWANLFRGSGPTRDVWHFDGAAWASYLPIVVRNDSSGRDATLALTEVKEARLGDLWASATVGPFGGHTVSETPVPALLHQQPNACGDGTIGACEECDPPARRDSGRQCGCNCRFLRCGNAVVDPGEDCDPPESKNLRALCDATCHFPICGNHKVDVGEECDPPDVGLIQGNTCDLNCKSIPIVCGNGLTQPGETCDFPDGIFCVGCQATACDGALYRYGGLTPETDHVCSSLAGSDRASCNAMLNCIARFAVYGCVFSDNCYCASADCSGGANGTCAAEIEAVAGSTDVAEVTRQLADPNTTVFQLLEEARGTSDLARARGAAYCP